MALQSSNVHRLRIAWLAILHATTACSGAIQAAPVFYVSNQDTGAAPGLLDLTVAPNSTGTLHIWVDTDVRLAGVSLDLIETGGAIKFTGLDVHNPNLPGPRWPILEGPQLVTDSAVRNIGGFLLPGPFGWGIGPGVPDGRRVVVASVVYETLSTPGVKSDLSLRVGRLGIGDFNGNFAQVRFGTESSAMTNGDAFGAGGPVGSIQIGGLGPPVITPVDLGEVSQTTTITANLVVGGVAIWRSDLTPLAGSPVIPATLDSNGKFSWDPTGSKRGSKGNGVLYSWSATATSPAGSTASVALTLRLIPEPATMTHLGLAIFGLLGLARRC